ncbi:5-oxoprolinase subunit PxpB [Agrilutibacter solisilvae]|uniref:5-oxoprolinase subunit PxpB n=1 Tax=Agrilutibacter solisilvae TaxID=2763317 RepID=A0A974XWX6_9GAMM|nr:5-oxoprolinase subunit PxpB [Lysobacter solisilvae]QSX77352.1 5-oxoprolinase subunit PxpB [Lysobacter solisilvae]
MSDAPALEALADDAWLLHLGDRIDPALNARVHALCAHLQARRPHWVRDLVPAYASVALFFDPAAIDGDAAARWLLEQAQGAAHSQGPQHAAGDGSRLVEIPVAYGGDDGPDLATSAAELGLTPEEFVRRHADREYTVAMIGFAPGFPYLLGLDPALALPRLATPRTRVPAGSVGIGGAQTGIYPRESPGGWRLIGRTPSVLFDATRQAPSLLASGDRVRFVPLPMDAA